jgi:hypothetical protein
VLDIEHHRPHHLERRLEGPIRHEVVLRWHSEYFRNVLFNIVKFFHILFVITAFGANITYGVWQARGAIDPAHESFALRGVKFLDDRVANPAYLVVLLTGLTMAWWHWSYTTHWISRAMVRNRPRIGAPTCEGRSMALASWCRSWRSFS